MTNSEEDKLPLKALIELKGINFLIPYQQRGYKWTQVNVEKLLCDLKAFIDDKPDKRVYCLQPLAVVSLGNQSYEVLDGQQRLTTLFLLYLYLFDEEPYHLTYERDSNDKGIKTREEYLSKIKTASEEDAKQCIDFYFIYKAYQQIRTTFESWNVDYKKDFKELLKSTKDKKSVQIIWYNVLENKKHETFRSLNSNKISLTNTELIKALLLNSVSGLPEKEREEAASQFEQIEHEMQNDHFWYMFSSEEPKNGQTRMDLLFNLVSGCKQSDYEINPRWSFNNYFDKKEKGSLSDKWKEVRHMFLWLKDMYDNIYYYHYIGFLTYCSNEKIASTKDLLNSYKKVEHSKFKEELRKQIKKILCNDNKSSIDDYRYDYSSKKELRQLFLMHNIETILQRYESLTGKDTCGLQHDFEQFPFELLYKQSWDIEHIASVTDSDLKSRQDREDWLSSIKEDLGNDYPADKDTEGLENRYKSTGKNEDFDKLFKHIMQHYDGTIKDSIKDDASDGKNKMQIGNITLLDSHTNRSYHNALFPRKRKYVLVAGGLANPDDASEQKIARSFIPPCTSQVFTKAYSKGSDLTLNTWTQTDANAYVLDMKQKLKYYFKEDNNQKQES